VTGQAIATSVIVVSRERPALLQRCLSALAMQQHPMFEVVVVADPQGCAAARETAFGAAIKIVAFDEANISAARNLGLAEAAGEVVAFIDDDSVAVPTWLSYLIAPFADPEVAATTGFVRGRNGISFQSMATEILTDGWPRDLVVPSDRPTRHVGEAGRGIKTEGTNMAFRRAVLAEIGGFDPTFRYYLDEADVNLRLAARGAVTVVEPRAKVLHDAAAGLYRSESRGPRGLFEIGASRAAFLVRHDPGGASEVRRAEARADHRRRLVGHMVAGRLLPGEVGWLLKSWDRGWKDGLSRPRQALRPLATAGDPFRQVTPARSTRPSPKAAYWWLRRRAVAQASATAAQGENALVWLYSFTGFRHRLRMDRPGVWLMRGGVFGRAQDSDPVWRFWTRRGRLAAESKRIAHFWVFRASDRQ
jgi:GT2 family glycosyltransferase